MPSQGHISPPYLYVLPTKQLCKPCFFFLFSLSFKGSFITWSWLFPLIHWPMALTQRQGSLLPEMRGGTKNSSPLITCQLSLLATSSHPWIGFKSYLCWSIYRNWRWETKYYPVAIITQKIPTVYGVRARKCGWWPISVRNSSYFISSSDRPNFIFP